MAHHNPPRSFSFNGELVPAAKKKHAETIVFVPFFDATRQQMQRHIKFVNALGYDCLIFDLKFKVDQHLMSATSGFGLKHVWADQIEQILNELPGRKIIYAFSNPSASAIESIARRSASDVVGLICDSGPSGQLWASMVNYFKYEKPITFLPQRWFTALSGTLLWSPQFNSLLASDLEKLPKGFPILSIRGWLDPLITPDQIDLVFDPHPHLKCVRLSLPKAKHLNGLKDFRDEYELGVGQFLSGLKKV